MTPENHAPVRVLMVDDDPLMRWSVVETLTAAGEAVVQASDAASAIEAIIAAGCPFDVILLDYRLPDSEDLSLLSEIRRRCPRSRVVLITAFATRDVVEEAQALGAYVVNKPFEMSDVDGLVRSALAA